MITVKYPSVKDRCTDTAYLKRLDITSDFYVRKISKLYQDRQPDINTIEIETINRCNNDCSFCPLNHNSDTRPYKKMSKTLFEKIISVLVQMDYWGYLSLFSNNVLLVGHPAKVIRSKVVWEEEDGLSWDDYLSKKLG